MPERASCRYPVKLLNAFVVVLFLAVHHIQVAVIIFRNIFIIM